MNPAEIVVIDLWSVVPDLHKTASKLAGTPVDGLIDYVRAEQERGSTIYFCAGHAHDAFWRQMIERFLEHIGIRAVFVTHGLPDGFSLFISTRAFPFDGKHFPIT